MHIPPVVNDLTKILMRFRLNKIEVSTDMEKAFLHVGLENSDRDVTRFLWLSDPNDQTSQLMTYRFKSVLIGATCSLFILNAALLKHLDKYKTETASTMKKDLYVDNVLSSLDNEKKALTYFCEARSLMSEAEFNLRSLTSNSSHLKNLHKLKMYLIKTPKRHVGIQLQTNFPFPK